MLKITFPQRPCSGSPARATVKRYGTASAATGYDGVRPLQSRFLHRRSHLAREQALRELEVTVQQVANLVLNASALADRMEAKATR